MSISFCRSNLIYTPELDAHIHVHPYMYMYMHAGGTGISGTVLTVEDWRDLSAVGFLIIMSYMYFYLSCYKYVCVSTFECVFIYLYARTLTHVCTYVCTCSH